MVRSNNNGPHSDVAIDRFFSQPRAYNAIDIE